MKAICAALTALFAWAAPTRPQSETRHTHTPEPTHATINTQEGGTP